MGYNYFENKGCEFYPCHKSEKINCLFCFCPLYHMEDCGGTPVYLEGKNGKIRDCSQCVFPHLPENYEKIIKKLEKGC